MVDETTRRRPYRRLINIYSRFYCPYRPFPLKHFKSIKKFIELWVTKQLGVSEKNVLILFIFNKHNSIILFLFGLKTYFLISF